ncbi:hypothetical protein Q3G72_024715 [Acer saccharum]|nr:hypothetical protein Q3G72_024715 [Acer saccharum]
MEKGNKQPLLSSLERDEEKLHSLSGRVTTTTTSFLATFKADSNDIPPITSVRDFFREFYSEFKKLWYLAGPAIFTSICQYLLGGITQLFCGHISTIAQAAFSVEDYVLGLFSYGQSPEISKATGKFSIWMIPQLFAFAGIFPVSKFLQAQSKIMVMMVISAVVLVLHTLFSWFLMLKLGWGLVGAAVVLNSSWWVIEVSQFLYVVSGTCGRAWSGFSWRAFQNLWGFVRLSLASALMLCLEMWYFMVLIIFAGYLENPKVSVDAMSICMNILGWAVMVAVGLNAAISVRVSNELGAGHPRSAQFSLFVAVISGFLMGLVFSLILFFTRDQYPSLFSKDKQVRDLVSALTPLLAISLTTDSIQPVLSGVAIGAGWQGVVAYVNIACYYILGIPLGLILAYKYDMGIKASIVEERIRRWGGDTYTDTGPDPQ